MTADTLKHQSNFRAAPVPRAFSITELLVVIGIIVLLLSLLLVALGTVRNAARRSVTESRMRAFSAACDQFFLDHGRYPGVVPEAILANDPQISGMENALLELMGGFRTEDDPEFQDYTVHPAVGCGEFGGWFEITFMNPNGGTYTIEINRNEIGRGPTIDGKPYAPYFSPGDGDIAAVAGQDELCGFGAFATGPILPEVIDGWGQPIIYLRENRSRRDTAAGGLFVGHEPDTDQFLHDTMLPYTESEGLGELGRDQAYDAANNEDGSVISEAVPDALENLAQLIRHPAFGDVALPQEEGVSRGKYILISPGPDGIYFSATDGAGQPGAPQTNLLDPMVIADFGLNITKEYDDILVIGGS